MWSSQSLWISCSTIIGLVWSLLSDWRSFEGYNGKLLDFTSILNDHLETSVLSRLNLLKSLRCNDTVKSSSISFVIFAVATGDSMHQQYLDLFWTLACCCCWRPSRTVSTSCPELTPKKPLRHLHPIYPLKIGRWKAGSQLPTQATLRWTLHKLSYCHVEMLDEILSIFYTWR